MSKYITKKKKIEFFEFALSVLKHENELDDDDVHYAFRGCGKLSFCAIYKAFFRINDFGFKSLPELQKYKPDIFYTVDGRKTKHDNMFWFPLDYKQSERIKICEEILIELK